MTPSQHDKYIRRWVCCTRTNHWTMRGGRLVDEAVRDASEWHEGVFTAATIRANREHRAPTAEDLRKGCHIVAFGRDKSSKVLTNDEFSRLLVLWGNGRELRDGGMVGLLIDPLDLASLNAWMDPAAAQVKTLLQLIKQRAPHAVIATIAKNAFGTEEFETLDLGKLKWLMGQLAHGRQFHADAGEPF